MALLDTQPSTISEADDAANRIRPVTVKLTADEHRELTEHVDHLGQARSEWIRSLILGELERRKNRSQVDPTLVEIVGIRLLLVNLLKPREDAQGPLSTSEYKAVIEGVRKAKHQVAKDITRECAEGGTR